MSTISETVLKSAINKCVQLPDFSVLIVVLHSRELESAMYKIMNLCFESGAIHNSTRTFITFDNGSSIRFDISGTYRGGSHNLIIYDEDIDDLIIKRIYDPTLIRYRPPNKFQGW